MPITVDYISDWTTRLQTRLYTQWRHAVTWNQWCDILGGLSQDWEDAAQSLFSLLSIEDSVGQQLDVIGRIVGQARVGLADSIYRIYLRARIAANRSTGVPEDIYTVFRLLYNLPMRLTNSPIREFMLRIIGAITPQEASLGVDFLTDSKETGARAVMVWQEVASSSLFTLDIGPGLGDGHLAGARQA